MARKLSLPWIESYLKYRDDSESPEDFLKWAAIATVGATLKRRVFVWWHGIKIFANQYVVLTGPPGIGKGEAIKPAVAIAKEAKAINYLSDKITAEKIIDKLATGFQCAAITAQGNVLMAPEHTACLLAKELPVFFAGSEWMHALLCQLWDENEFEYQTKNRGSYEIKDMCVSLLAGCVPDYVRTLSRDNLAPVTGGFSARTIFVYASRMSKINSGGFGAPNGNHGRLFDDLVNDLNHIASLQGEAQLSDDARLLWEQKYKEYRKVGDFESDALANFKSRIPSHILKLALSISVSARDDLIVNRNDLDLACKWIERVRDSVDVTFRSVGESPLVASQARIMDFIENRGICSRTEILRYNHKHVTDEQLTAILHTLETIGFCSTSTQGNKLYFEHNPKFNTTP